MSLLAISQSIKETSGEEKKKEGKKVGWKEVKERKEGRKGKEKKEKERERKKERNTVKFMHNHVFNTSSVKDKSKGPLGLLPSHK